MLCRDRFAVLPVETFKIFTCSMCYAYLFRDSPDLRSNYPSMPPLLIAPPGSQFPPRAVVIPDIENITVKKYVCSSLDPNNNNADCRRWTDCCLNAIECCKQQIEETEQFFSANESYCPRTWDGYGCWNDTLAGSIASGSCPHYIEHSDANLISYRECTENGTWWRDPDTNLEWTNYITCMGDKLEHYRIISFVGIACSVISILLLVPSMGIFLAFRQLYSQQRIKIHLNLFASFIITAVSFILWEVLVHQDRLGQQKEDTVIHRNTPGCKVLYVATRYSELANFFWMFCEGLYLHRLIVNTFEAPKYLIGYYICGWGVSFLPILAYSIIRATTADENCWIRQIEGPEWIIYTPSLLCILANLVFLCSILRILLTQLQSHPNEPSNYRRALKATFILVPLFGIQLFLVIYRPEPFSPISFPYEIIAAIVKNLQGAMIAVIFCFLNGEVITKLKSSYKRRKYADQDFLRSYSASTQLTTDATSRKSSAGRSPKPNRSPSSDNSPQNHIPLNLMADDGENGLTAMPSQALL